jgi:hypothetical protein
MRFHHRLGLSCFLFAIYFRTVLLWPMDFWPGIVPALFMMVANILLVLPSDLFTKKQKQEVSR